MLCDDRLPAAAARYTGVMASLVLSISRGPPPVLILPLLALDMSLQKGGQQRGSISVSDMATVYGVQFKPINLVSMLDDLTDADALIN